MVTRFLYLIFKTSRTNFIGEWFHRCCLRDLASTQQAVYRFGSRFFVVLARRGCTRYPMQLSSGIGWLTVGFCILASPLSQRSLIWIGVEPRRSGAFEESVHWIYQWSVSFARYWLGEEECTQEHGKCRSRAFWGRDNRRVLSGCGWSVRWYFCGAIVRRSQRCLRSMSMIETSWKPIGKKLVCRYPMKKKLRNQCSTLLNNFNCLYDNWYREFGLVLLKMILDH